MTDNMLGWELLLRALKSDIKRKEDVLVILIHYSLLKSDFKCFGKGQNWSDDETGSELLPADWNTDDEYGIRYKRNGDKFLLITTHIEDSVIIFNLTMCEKLEVTNITCKYDDIVASFEGDISSMVPTYKSFVETVDKKLISPFIVSEKNFVEVHTQTPPLTKDDKNRCGSSRLNENSVRERASSLIQEPRIPDIRSVGQRDLDPFGLLQPRIVPGGNVFDPFLENRRPLHLGGIPEPLPRGSVPSRARFDPFAPPDSEFPSRRLPPDYDDMFS